jgi:tetratricopeptide (TPR) repeat protein
MPRARASTGPPAAGSGGGSAEARFLRAGEAYEAGRHAEAAGIYEALIAEGLDDARIHYNLGNARFREGRLGVAILAYERALMRDPSDIDARENLAYASLQIADDVGTLEPGPFAALASVLTRNLERSMRWLILCAVLAGGAGVPLWFAPPAFVRRACRICLSIALPAALLLLSIVILSLAARSGSRHAIILAEIADGRSAPTPDGTILFTVHEGLKVELRGEKSGWLQIALPNGLAGWIVESGAGRIER